MSLKNDFPIFANNPWLIYLDSAATLQKPAHVIDGMKAYMEHDYANIHRGRYSLSEKSEELYRQARKKVAALLHSADDEVIFTANATDGINKLVQSLILSWCLEQWDTVLLTELEHHANIVPWQMAAKHQGIQLDFVGLHRDATIGMVDFENKIQQKPKIVACTMVSNVTGEILNIERIVEMIATYSPETLLMVDASQAVPHMSVDVKELWADALVFTGHKIGASTGIGVLRVKKKLLGSLEPSFWWWWIIEEVTKEWYILLDAPDIFEPGTPNLIGAVSLLKSIEYMEQVASSHQSPVISWLHWFYNILDDLESSLIVYCLQQFEQLEKEWVILLWPKNPTKRIWVFSFLLPEGKFPTQLGQWMAKENICVRCGGQCAHVLHKQLGWETMSHTCRISLWGYNEMKDVEAFFEKLREFISFS